MLLLGPCHTGPNRMRIRLTRPGRVSIVTMALRLHGLVRKASIASIDVHTRMPKATSLGIALGVIGVIMMSRTTLLARIAWPRC